MKPIILRLLWLIGSIPVFTLEIIGFAPCILIYLVLACYYFVKTGDQELTDLYDSPLQPIMWLDKKYHNLLNKIEK